MKKIIYMNETKRDVAFLLLATPKIFMRGYRTSMRERKACKGKKKEAWMGYNCLGHDPNFIVFLSGASGPLLKQQQGDKCLTLYSYIPHYF